MSAMPASSSSESTPTVAGLERLVRRLHTSNTIAMIVLSTITGLVVLLFLIIIVYLLIQGLPYVFNPVYYDTAPHSTLTILPQIYNTAYILVATEILLVPLALGAAIYLIEYARQGPLVTVIHFAAETLAGVPSLVLGLFGFVFFATILGFGYSRLSATLALLCMNFPLALRLFEDALTAVSRDQREAALALGSNKWHAIRTAVLPLALPGIVTAVVLSAGKVLAESAVIYFTGAATTTPRHPYNLDPLASGETLALHIYEVQGLNANSNTPDQIIAIAAVSAAILIIALLVINIGARALGRFVQRRLTAA